MHSLIHVWMRNSKVFFSGCGKNSRVRGGMIGLLLLIVIICIEFAPFTAYHAQAKVAINSTVATVNTECSHVSFSSDGNPFPLCPGTFPQGGNCVWWTWEQWHLLGYDLPRNWGNAQDWIMDAQRAGFTLGTTPRVGSIVVFPKNDGTWAGPVGHVAFVTSVSQDGSTFDVTYQNYGDPQFMYVGSGFNLDLINQPRFQDGQVRFIYFPRTIDVSLFMNLPGLSKQADANSDVEQANRSLNNNTTSAIGANATAHTTLTSDRVAVGLVPTSSDQEFNADFTGNGVSHLLLYDRQKGDIKVFAVSPEQQKKPRRTRIMVGGELYDPNPDPENAPSQFVSLGDSITPAGRWGPSLDIHVGNFSGAKTSEILLYNRVDGSVQILSLGPDLQIAKHVTLSEKFGSDWELSVGRFNGTSSGLFMYKRFAMPDVMGPAPTSSPTNLSNSSNNNQSNFPSDNSTNPSGVIPGLEPSPVISPAPTVNPTSSSTTPKQKVTVTPTATATGIPKMTPTATSTPMASPVPATPTVAPTADPTASPTPAPTATPDPTPAPTATPDPTAVSATATPDPTPAPTAMNTPAASPTATATPASTITPTATPTSAATPSTPTPIPTQPTSTATPGASADNGSVATMGFALPGNSQPATTVGNTTSVGNSHELSGEQLQDWEKRGRTANIMLLDFDKDLNIQHKQEYTLWHSSWEVYVGRFVSSQQDGIFLYDRVAGEGRIMDFDATLAVNDYHEMHNLDGSWVVYSGDFTNSGRAQLLFYNPNSGDVQTLSFSKQLELQSQKLHSNMGTNDVLYVGHFGMPTLSIMLYDPVSAQSTFVGFDQSFEITHQYMVKSWDQGWQILVGAFSDRSRCHNETNCANSDDILLLNRQSGQIEQYAFSFGRQFTVYDNRVQSFMRQRVSVTEHISPVDSSTFSLVRSISTTIKNEELY